MLLLRKIDYYGQLILISCTLLSIPFLYLFGTGAGLFLLGCWQLTSAIANTAAFIHTGYKKKIMVYWMLSITDLALIALFFLPGNNLAGNPIMVIFWIATGAAVFIACYYLTIYYRLIEHISLRNELDGLTKSKH